MNPAAAQPRLSGRWLLSISILALVALFAGTVQPLYFRVLDSSRQASLRQFLSSLRYRGLEDLEPFLAGVRKEIRPETTILIVIPPGLWSRSEPIRYRAAYELPGRRVLIARSGEPLPESAEYLGFFRLRSPRLSDYRLVWRGPEGSLLERGGEEP